MARPALGPDNQGQGEADKARFLIDELKRIGFDTVRELRSDDDRVSCGYRPNLVTVLPGEDTGRTLW
ncbi:MAG: M20 family metallo-hydrolase, partial [Desulfohalobiaceae bacterium]